MISANQKSPNEFKLTLVSMHNILPTSFILKMAPELNEKNFKSWRQQILAIGCSTGALLIYNLNKMRIYKKFSLFNNPVIGIEWCSRNSIIVWSHSSSNSVNSFQPHEPLSSGTSSNQPNKQTLVKNEILLIDIRTGK